MSGGGNLSHQSRTPIEVEPTVTVVVVDDAPVLITVNSGAQKSHYNSGIASK